MARYARSDTWFERIDMAVFSAVPEFVRLSVLLGGCTPAKARQARALLRSVSASVAASSSVAAGGREPGRVDAWSAAYEAVGITGNAKPPHAVLMAWAAEPGGVPSTGALPDIANAFSLQHQLPVAVYDLAGVSGGVWLRPARGIEAFEPLGGGAEAPDVGELVLADDAPRVLARHWHGAADRTTRAGPGTSDALVHVDVLAPGAGRCDALADEFVRLATAFVGATASVRRLTRHCPQARWPA